MRVIRASVVLLTCLGDCGIRTPGWKMACRPSFVRVVAQDRWDEQVRKYARLQHGRRPRPRTRRRSYQYSHRREGNRMSDSRHEGFSLPWPAIVTLLAVAGG